MDKEIQMIAGIIIVLLFIVCIILTILALKKAATSERKLARLKEELDKTRNTVNSGNPALDTVEQQELFNKFSERLTELENKQEKCLDRVDIVRYFASDKNEGRSSYSIGITNAKKDGLVLTALMYRNGMNLYAKNVNEGVSDYPLSEEEKEAVSRSKVTKILG
ncbi:MAG: DUF4446 family protein [Clostridia bacterium]|nr:DUF4446 family protein [Clostridia bacterium]